MGRHRREYPQGKLRLKYDKRKWDKEKSYTLNYEYTWLNEPPVRKDSGVRVRVEDWNPNSNNGIGGLRASYGAEYRRVNTTLADNLQKYDAQLQLYSQKHPHQMTTDVIRAILSDAPMTRNDEAKDFIDYAKSRIDSKLSRKKIGKSRYENQMSCMKGFKEFLAAKEMGTYNEKKSIYLGDISATIVDAYINFRREVKGNSDETINHALTPIIDACKNAADEGLINRKLYSQIKDCRVVATPNLEEDKFDGKSYLTKEELRRLVEYYETDTEPRRKEYIEMFLFAFHAGGMRPVDVMTLKWSHINFDTCELRKILIKTQKGRLPRHTIPLNDAAIAILRKWKERGRREKFVFDLVDDDFNVNDEAALYYRRNACERTINQSLNVVGKKIGLTFPLTFKVARHTFAILALQNSMSISLVSRMMGHSSTDTTESYYSDYLPQTLKDEIEKLDFNFIPNFDKN